MSQRSFLTSFPWVRYSRKLVSRIEKLRCAGYFASEESEARDVKLAEGLAGAAQEGNLVHFYWLVDKDDGIIIDAKFQAFGQTALLGAAEVTCELLIGKNYDQARRINIHLIDQQLQDRGSTQAFPPETVPHLNLIIEAINAASQQCDGIPLAPTYVAPPMPIDIGEIVEGGYPGWLELTQPQKIAIIEEVLNRDIRPYIALDAGGVEIVELVQDTDLIIAYQGTCTSCYSSIGTTLSYIQQILKAKVHPSLVVIPKL